MKQIIREANSQDLPLLVDFQQRMAMETESLTLKIETVTSGIEHLMANPSKGQYFVAEVDGTVVGCLMITYEWSDWRSGTIWWIQSVYVVEAYRRKGVFASLYNHLKAGVEAAPDVRGIRLYVERNNMAAKEIYQQLGMSGDHYELFEWMK